MNGIDDMLRKVITTKYSVTETFKMRDTRLMICFVACLFSAVGCLYDYLHPFPGECFSGVVATLPSNPGSSSSLARHTSPGAFI